MTEPCLKSFGRFLPCVLPRGHEGECDGDLAGAAADAEARLTRLVRCARCRYHYRRELMSETNTGFWICRDQNGCEARIQQRRRDQEALR